MRLAYENADTYVRWRLGAYFDVQGEQADELNDRIDAFHVWHRRNALPQYTKLAREAARRVDAGASRADMVWGYDSLRGQARESLRAAAEGLAPLLDRLNDEQIAHIERRIEVENRQFQRERLRGTEGERRGRRTKYMVERLEDWVGKLSQAQLERVREFGERAPLLGELQDRDRKRLQADVVAILRAREARARLAERVANWERGRDPVYRAALESYRGQLFTLLAELERSLSAEQRARFSGHLRRYAEDFEALAAR